MFTHLKVGIIFATQFLLSLLSLLRNIGRGEKINFTPSVRDKICVCIGNGPSLQADINKLLGLVGRVDFLCVNHFPDSAYFEMLKPKAIFFADPYFWMDDASGRLKAKREATFDNLVGKTSWEIMVYIPAYADKLVFERIAKKNNLIKIFRFSAVEAGNQNETVTHLFWDTGYFTPAGYNVLCPLIFSAIRLGYRDIYIYGADMSFHEGLEIDQVTNKLFSSATHFYGKTKNPVYFDWTESCESSVSREFSIYAERFLCFERIASYARKNNVKIFNSSAFSWIDSFERKELT